MFDLALQSSHASVGMHTVGMSVLEMADSLSHCRPAPAPDLAPNESNLLPMYRLHFVRKSAAGQMTSATAFEFMHGLMAEWTTHGC